MKRHMKPWGCTFVTCHKRFGSKNDWKRHENSQHFHLETWRCDVEKEESDGGAAVACAKVCYRRQTFQEHLSQKHQLLSDIDVKTKLETCRMGRNCQARFWCGFCTKLIDLSKKGLDAWNERFDHIDDHFSGKNGHQEQDIQDWIPLNSNEQQGDVEDLSLDKASPADSESSSSGSSSENSSPAVGSSAGETRLEGSLSRKRASSSDDDGIRAPKRTKTVIFCVSIFALTSTFPNLTQNPSANVQCNITLGSKRIAAIAAINITFARIAPIARKRSRRKIDVSISSLWCMTLRLSWFPFQQWLLIIYSFLGLHVDAEG